MHYKHPTEIPRSEFFTDFQWIGDRITCMSLGARGDTHPLTWADDDEIYVGTGDPNWISRDDGSIMVIADWDKAKYDDDKYRRATGLTVEKFTGRPEEFALERVNDMPDFIGGGGCGPKPTGMICVDGTLYYAMQNLLGWKPPKHGKKSQHGSDAMILASGDHGKTWMPDIGGILSKMEAEQYDRSKIHAEPWGGWKTPPESRTEYEGWKPMFPGSLFGGPSFVQFGRDNQDAHDDFIYAISADQWDNGNAVRLGRVHKTEVLNADAWSFADTDGKGNVSWHKGLESSKPVLVIEHHMSLPEMVYLPSAKKYLLATCAFHEDFHAARGSELTILESDNMWGPFSLVYYEWMWYKQEAGCYCPRIPLKWFDHEKLTGWLEHSGNWETYIPYYLPQIRPFRLTCSAADTREK